MDIFVPTDDGHWVSEEFERLAQVIKDYDEYLELRWIPTDKRTRDDKEPYIVVDVRTNSPVLYATELDTPVDILERLFNADNKHGNVLTRLETRNTAIEVLNKRKQLDELEELHDKANFMLNSPLHTINMNGKKFDHQRRLIT